MTAGAWRLIAQSAHETLRSFSRRRAAGLAIVVLAVAVVTYLLQCHLDAELLYRDPARYRLIYGSAGRFGWLCLLNCILNGIGVAALGFMAAVIRRALKIRREQPS